MEMSKNHLVEVENLKKYFPIHKGFFKRVKGYVKAVDDITFVIKEGETFGIVGESGCGKTTLGQCLLQAINPTKGRVAIGATAVTLRLEKSKN